MSFAHKALSTHANCPKYLMRLHAVETIAVDGIFISIGRTPETEIFKGILELDNNGYIIADELIHRNNWVETQ